MLSSFSDLGTGKIAASFFSNGYWPRWGMIYVLTYRSRWLVTISGIASGGYRFRPRLWLRSRRWSGASVGIRVLVTALAHSKAIAQTIVAASSDRMDVMGLPVTTKRLVAPPTVATVAHLTLTPAAGAPVGGHSHFL